MYNPSNLFAPGNLAIYATAKKEEKRCNALYKVNMPTPIETHYYKEEIDETSKSLRRS